MELRQRVECGVRTVLDSDLRRIADRGATALEEPARGFGVEVHEGRLLGSIHTGHAVKQRPLDLLTHPRHGFEIDGAGEGRHGAALVLVRQGF